MAGTVQPAESIRRAIFAIHGISPFQRYAFLDWVAERLQGFLNSGAAGPAGGPWKAAVYWPRVSAKNIAAPQPSALRLYRGDSPDEPQGVLYDVYEGYWSPLSKGRTTFASALNWIFTSTFLGTNSTARIPCTWPKLAWDFAYVAALLFGVVGCLAVAALTGVWAWGAFIAAYGAPPHGSYWALVLNPLQALQLPVLAYLQLAIDAAAAYVLVQLFVMHGTGARRKRRTRRLADPITADDSHFKLATIAARDFHRVASALLWLLFFVLAFAAVEINRIGGPPNGLRVLAAAVVTVSLLFFQFARSLANFAVEDVLGDIQIYTTHDQNSAYFAIREQIVQTVSAALLGVLQTTDGSPAERPYYDAVHVFGHSLGATVAMDVLIRLRQLVDERIVDEAHWKRVRSLTTFGSALEKTRFFFDVRHPTINAAQDQWENDVYGPFFTDDIAALRDPANSRGVIYWSNLWYFRDIVANEIVSYRSDVAPGSSSAGPAAGRSFLWSKTERAICANCQLPYRGPFYAWLHGAYLSDPSFWRAVEPVILP
jgi:pimeloyl-ACP methyl ester carboxylesterase